MGYGPLTENLWELVTGSRRDAVGAVEFLSSQHGREGCEPRGEGRGHVGIRDDGVSVALLQAVVAER